MAAEGTSSRSSGCSSYLASLNCFSRSFARDTRLWNLSSISSTCGDLASAELIPQWSVSVSFRCCTSSMEDVQVAVSLA